MELVISAIERQIKIETGKMVQRQVMLANKDAFVFTENLPEVNLKYIEQLQNALWLVKTGPCLLEALKCLLENSMLSVAGEEIAEAAIIKAGGL